MPEDHGYKYLLTCIELKRKAGDMEPLKKKDGETLKRAFTAIWNRGNIDPEYKGNI